MLIQCKRNKKRRGSTTGLVLVVSVVLFILGATYNMLVRQRSRLISKQAIGEITFTIGEAFLEMSSEMLRNMLKDPSSGLFKELVKPWSEFSTNSKKEFELTLNSTQGVMGLTEMFKEPLDDITQIYGGVNEIDVTAIAIVIPKNFKPLSCDIDKTAVCNKLGTIQLNLDISFQGAHRRIGVEHQARVMTARAPALRKFTLFIDNGAHSTGDKEIYNSVYMDSRGEPDNGNKTPVTVSNGYACENWKNFNSFPSDITGTYIEKFRKLIMQRMGWIYIGKGPCNLSLTHGTSDNTYSEDFHFFRKTTTQNSGRAYMDPKVETSQSGDDLYQMKNNYQVNRWDKGLYKLNGSGEQEALLLKKMDSKYGKTSLFHLYGHYSPGQCQASPTLVLGQVAARYLSLSALRRRSGADTTLIDNNHKFFPLPFLDITGTLSDENKVYSVFEQSGFNTQRSDYYKRSAMLAFEGIPDSETPPPDPVPLWPKWNVTYKDVMSTTRLRAYNQSLDFIREGNSQINISDNTLNQNSNYQSIPINDDEVSAGAYALPTSNGDIYQPEFANDMTDVRAFFEQAKSRSYMNKNYGDNQPEFCRIFKDTGNERQTGSEFMDALEKCGMLIPPVEGGSSQRLNLSSLIYVDGAAHLGNIELLTSCVIIAKSGITITGDIKVGGVAGRDVLLTLISQKSIDIKSEATEISASLVALDGTIRLNGSSPLNISGNMIMKNFPGQAINSYIKRPLHLEYNTQLSAKPGEPDYTNTCFIDINPNPTYLERP